MVVMYVGVRECLARGLFADRIMVTETSAFFKDGLERGSLRRESQQGEEERDRQRTQHV